ncbi:hypothetical protein VDGE_08992 [Verticillium dahliae]|uniref:Zn(2)-C6 fungal-type domain-containing protein n=1 Tax=Verticillium dahliae TaxID=27337 RepID=A0A444S5U8_VERDA|nr:hypothetical protein VDGE_08992 [Verticillium dahliae]
MDSSASSAAQEAKETPIKPPADDRDNDDQDEAARKKAAVRKRTKTGCLTCRKRRIKCDEGRPICNNCTKSKRNCEGYNQRVIFKDPLGAFQNGSFGPLVYPPESREQQNLVSHGNQQSKPSSHAPPLAAIAPKPPMTLDFQNYPPVPYGESYQAYQQHQPSAAASSTYSFNQGSYEQPPVPANTAYIAPVASVHQQRKHSEGQQYLPSPAKEEDGFHGFGDSSHTQTKSYAAQNEVVASGPGFQDTEVPMDEVQERTQWEHVYSDEDASMGESEDEFEALPRESTYGTLVQSHMDGPLDGFGTEMRTFTAFANDETLTSYIPQAINSPLNDSKTAALFWHFVNVTGPSMSLYERHPFDHKEKMMGNHQAPNSNHSIWTYTFPIVAFHHPALLQSMLAIGSLQIARLKALPPTAAMKHYHLAIRRIARNVRSHTKRTQPATLASTLLLAFFEVWNSDHSNWCQHLLGARLLFKEIPFRDMTRNILPLKRARRAMFEQERNQPLDPFFMGHDNGEADKIDLDDLDLGFLSEITGQNVDYEEGTTLSGLYYTDRDIEQYEHLRDLFWWYSKMDVYQGLLSGGKPFMEYEHWTQCPPRAPMGRLEAIYGTYDHLVLVMARLMTFAAKDLPRKRKSLKTFGMMGGGSPPMFPGMLPNVGKTSLPMGFSPPREGSPPKENPDEIDLESGTAEAMREWEAIRAAFETLRARFGPEFEPLGPEYADRRDSPFGPTLQYRTFSVAGVWLNYYMCLIHLYRTHPMMPPAAMIAQGIQARHTAHFAQEIGRIAAGLCDDLRDVTEISIQFQDDVQRKWIIKRLHDIARLTGWQSARMIAEGCESGWRKAAEMGRGPPYTRDPNLMNEIPKSMIRGPPKIMARIEKLDSDDAKLAVARSERAAYAIGLIGIEQELSRLDLKEGN